MSQITGAIEKGFLWLDTQKPESLKEISRFSLAYTLWKKDNRWISSLKEGVQNYKEEKIRDVARILSSAGVSGILSPDATRWIEEQQEKTGSWGKKDVYDTTYALAALADMNKYNPAGCNWLLDNFYSKWEHPGTVSLIVTALVKQEKAGNTDIYDDFIRCMMQWLYNNKEADGGWKHIATTTIVIDACINAGYPDTIHNAVEWLLGKQNPEGSWSKNGNDKNATAMVLACFAKINMITPKSSLYMENLNK